MHQDRCDGPVLATFPLPNPEQAGRSFTLDGHYLPKGVQTMCPIFTASIDGPLYALARVASPPPPPPPPFASVDAMRGCTVAAMLLVNDPGDWDHVFAPLDHARWNGCTPTDLIFPFFLFVIGVSIALSILPRLEQARAPHAVGNAAVGRWATSLRVAINAPAAWCLSAAHMRRPGVCNASVCVSWGPRHVRHPYAQARVVDRHRSAVARLYRRIGAGGTLDPWVNIVSRTDSAVFGHYVWSINPDTGQGHDPEGLLSTLPAMATALLGLCAGCWLRSGQVRRLLIAGVLIVAAGALWSFWIPFNKNLWTPSFTLCTAGWAKRLRQSSTGH